MNLKNTLLQISVGLIFLMLIAPISASAINPRLPAGEWDITTSKWQDTAYKGKLKIVDIDASGKVKGSFQGVPIVGIWEQNNWKLTWSKSIKGDSNSKYTGYLILEPGCSTEVTYSCKYTLAGFFDIAANPPNLGVRNGWYAQLTVGPGIEIN